MDKQSIIKIAFAVNELNLFENKHFGDAYKYMIFECNNVEFIKKEEAINKFIHYDETQAHGSKKKGEAIIDFLKQKDVKVIVSMQFGKNIKLVNKHFIPVIVKTNNIQETKRELIKHIKWLKDELKNKNDNYMLFKISTGMLKSSIK